MNQHPAWPALVEEVERQMAEWLNDCLGWDCMRGHWCPKCDGGGDA